ncbi:tyrosine-type recombinase/integrase [Bifidobacterium callitrichos]|uniref:Phage integrase family protein n=1 Tax=Bifidobacterium callitrichos DSM 23973 TaxID=1437609 RepID=A0A087A915_9BIFI|nr:site-specific integrase [Bifidobacterium callitrichos]KFI55265.1 phage integrase family protein [Bifidobacterium callitrichos DSM 23973]
MGRPRKRLRASEGKRTAKRVRRNGKVYEYVEYSFVTPLWAFTKWPDVKLPARTSKLFALDRTLDGEAWLNESLRAVHAGTWMPEKLKQAKAKREGITFREFATDWVEHRKKTDGSDLKETAKQKYRESLDLYLLPYFGDMALTDITPKVVQAWFDSFTTARLDADLSNRRAHVYRHLQTMMRSAAAEPIDNEGHTLIPISPCRIRVGKPQVKHTPVRPTREQLDALLDALPEYVRMVARICDSTGLREGEALGLCRRHIDLKGLKIHVRQQVQRVRNAKTGRYETVITTPKTVSSVADVPMTQALADALADWIDSHRITNPDAPLFTSKRTGTWITPQNYRNAFADARRKVPGLETMRPHDLRKDCLSRMAEAGATIPEIMRQGRHVSMDVASRYQVTGEDHMNDVMTRMNDYETGRSTPSASATAPDIGGTASGDTVDANPVALAGVLAGMDAVARGVVLASLPPERRGAVLAAMSSIGRSANAIGSEEGHV